MRMLRMSDLKRVSGGWLDHRPPGHDSPWGSFDDDADGGQEDGQFPIQFPNVAGTGDGLEEITATFDRDGDGIPDIEVNWDENGEQSAVISLPNGVQVGISNTSEGAGGTGSVDGTFVSITVPF
jgi:hypothetical protein